MKWTNVRNVRKGLGESDTAQKAEENVNETIINILKQKKANAASTKWEHNAIKMEQRISTLKFKKKYDHNK